MRQIELIDFPDDVAERLAVSLMAEGYQARCRQSVSDADCHADAIILCGDGNHWRQNVSDIRYLHGGKFLVVATRLPDHNKWLDALEAGADDYCCAPLDARQIGWLVERNSVVELSYEPRTKKTLPGGCSPELDSSDELRDHPISGAGPASSVAADLEAAIAELASHAGAARTARQHVPIAGIDIRSSMSKTAASFQGRRRLFCQELINR